MMRPLGEVIGVRMHFVLALLTIGAAGLAQAQDVAHIESGGTWRDAPLTNSALDDRVREAAVRYREYAPVARVAFFDIALPRDSVEFEELGGYAVIVVTALSQDSTELPVARLYLERVTGPEELSRVGGALSRVGDAAISAVLGDYRADAMYLIPVNDGTKPAEIMMDFRRNRDGFRLGTRPSAITELPIRRAELIRPSAETVARFVQREFPSLSELLPRPEELPRSED